VWKWKNYQQEVRYYCLYEISFIFEITFRVVAKIWYSYRVRVLKNLVTVICKLKTNTFIISAELMSKTLPLSHCKMMYWILDSTHRLYVFLCVCACVHTYMYIYIYIYIYILYVDLCWRKQCFCARMTKVSFQMIVLCCYKHLFKQYEILFIDF
jgi:hypothetical protein